MVSVPSSVGAFAGENCPRRPKKDFYVQPGRPCSRVSKIQSNHLVERCPAPPADLPQARDSRLHLEDAAAVPRLIALQLIPDGRPRAHQRHIAFQHIKELRKLVQACLAQYPANARDARVMLNFVNGFLAFLSRNSQVSGDESLDVFPVKDRIVAALHRPEFKERKRRAAKADSFLLEKNRPFRGELDQRRDDRQQRRTENQGRSEEHTSELQSRREL